MVTFFKNITGGSYFTSSQGNDVTNTYDDVGLDNAKIWRFFYSDCFQDCSCRWGQIIPSTFWMEAYTMIFC